MTRAGRLLAVHALAAIATTLPVPLVVQAVYRATGSAGALAVFGAVRMLPFVVLGAAAGRLVDRADRPLLLAASASVRAALATAIAATAVLHGPAIVLAGLAVALAVAATPGYSAAGSALGSLAGGAELERAMTMLTGIETGAWVAGPALGGLLMTCGAPWMAAVAAELAALAAAFLVSGLRLPPSPGQEETGRGSMWQVLGSVPLLVAAVALANVAIDGTGAVLVMLSGGDGYGVLVAALGAGAALALAGSGVTRAGHLPGYLALTAVSLVGASVCTWTPLRAVLLLAGGAAAVAVEAAVTVAFQRRVPGDRHGEALGVLDQAIVGGALTGTVAGPLLAGVVGPAVTVAASGLVLVPVLVLLRRPARPAAPPLPAGEEVRVLSGVGS